MRYNVNVVFVLVDQPRELSKPAKKKKKKKVNAYLTTILEVQDFFDFQEGRRE